MTALALLHQLAAPLRAPGPLDLAAWSSAWPEVEAIDRSAIVAASVASIARKRHKALLSLVVRGDPQALVVALADRGLDLRRGHAARGEDDLFLEVQGGEATLEAHLLLAAVEPAARMEALVAGVGFGADLLALAARGDAVEVELRRAPDLVGAVTTHVRSPAAAEQELLDAGFVEAEVRGVPALVRGRETILLAGGTWYAYAGALPARLPVSAEE